MTLNTDLEKAKQILKEKNCSCVFCRGNDVIIKTESGIAPLVGFTDSEIDYSDFCAADRIIGKAAAFIYVLLNVKAVHGSVMSVSAVEILNHANIAYSYDVLADSIINRTGTGLCPMEDAVKDTDDPQTALVLIKNKLSFLKKN